MKKAVLNINRLPGYFCLLLILFCLAFFSCKKDSFITSQNALLSTSVDSLKYDTVFTTTGSVTKFFKINNPNNQKILLSRIKLMNGASSAFKININGIASAEVKDLEIAAGDSMYVFVTVSINAGNTSQPFIVKDSIEIMYNGNSHFVQLQAYGQNANFLRNRTITGNVTWVNNLPYVLSGSLHIDPTATLTIEAGCKIYCHADAPIIADGTLKINGTLQQPVVFNGDRLDKDYKDLPASWPGIYFTGTSQNNVIKYAYFKNAYQAIVVEKPSVNANPKLTMHQCVIDNAFDAGIICVNSSMQADNSLITNCGTNISITYGGNYNFTNCTAAAYSSVYSSHKKPVLVVNNFASTDGNTLTADLNAVFTNCIFWADNSIVDNEITVDKQGSNLFSVFLNYCLYKAKTDPQNSTITACIKNQDPLFDSIDVSKPLYNFHTNNVLAPGINKGIGGTGYLKDLDDKNRNVGLPDIGCYEKQ